MGEGGPLAKALQQALNAQWIFRKLTRKLAHSPAPSSPKKASAQSAQSVNFQPQSRLPRALIVDQTCGPQDQARPVASKFAKLRAQSRELCSARRQTIVFSALLAHGQPHPKLPHALSAQMVSPRMQMEKQKRQIASRNK